MEVKKAVVLAAGFGERLRPLTLVAPKPLLPVWGVPMLERIFARLEEWGVEEIAVNAHWQADKVKEYCRLRAAAEPEKGKRRAKIVVSEEPEILGTGGLLNPLRGFIGSDPFWLVNGDVVMEDVDPAPIRAAFERSGNFAGCWLSDTQGPRTVEADPEGRVCNWRSEFPGDHGTYTYCGCALLSPALLDYVPPAGFSTLVDAYEKAMMKDARFVVGATEPEAFWGDAGTLESYLEIHAALDLERFEENPNVLFPGVKFTESAELSGCVATGGLIGGAFTRTALVGVAQTGDARLNALANGLGWPREDAAAVFLGARGSDRAFWRLVRGDDRAVAILYDDAARAENARYAGHARLLAAAGVPVPKVLADLPAHKALALEDCGGESLEDRAAKGGDLVRIYRPVVEALARLHVDGTAAVLATDAVLEPAFGPELYAWERDLFVRHSVQGRFGLERLPEAVEREFEDLAAMLGRARPVVVHRDFQSSNVLFRADGSFAFIDFQGMRLGAAAYDLASLLYDPYVSLDERARKALAKAYAAAAPELKDAVELLPFAAVQRLAQALGAYGRLASVGQNRFDRYVSPALANLLAAADEANLDALGAFAEDLVSREEIRQGRFPHHHHGISD